MPGPIERWLDTFMCGQFAENFDRFGYRTLQSVCQLQVAQLMSMGIPQNDSEVIYQNVQSMCQSSNTPHQQMQLRNIYYNRMPHDVHGMPCQPRDSSQSQMNCMPQDNSCYTYGNQNVGTSGHFYNQGMHQSPDVMNAQYRQPYQGSGFSNQHQQQQPDRTPFPCMGMSSSNSSMSSRNNSYSGHVPGAPLINHSNMRQSHPHLRNSGQNPQEVANNILHMAASSYPSNHTVQVPLSKNRSAPYHLPNRSPSYNAQAQESQQAMGHEYNQGQFMYPSPPHQSQLQQSVRDPRMSPVSPGSGNMCSPLSHHSGRSMPSSSPCSMHSPGIGNVRSPGPNSQMMNSPQRNPYPMSSPMTAPNQRMVSPVPTSQQLQVNVPSSVAQQMPQCYGSNSSNSIQFQNHPPQAMAQYSPGLSACNSPGSHSAHLVQSPSAPSFSQSPGAPSFSQSPGAPSFSQSPGAPSFSQSPGAPSFSHSPGTQSGYHSNISSPFTPSSRASYHSPSHTHTSPTVDPTVPETNFSSSSSSKQCTSPLQSLQKLCMLPESQVVDPKSVVKEACVSSPIDGNQKQPDNTSACLMDGNQYWSSSDKKQSDTEFPVPSEQPPSNTCESVISPDKYQPKKMMLLRAAKEDFSSNAQIDSDIPASSDPPCANTCNDSFNAGSINQQNGDTTVSSNDNTNLNEIKENVGSNKNEEVSSESHDGIVGLNNDTSNSNFESIEASNSNFESTEASNSMSETTELSHVPLEVNTPATTSSSAVDVNDSSQSDKPINDGDSGVCNKDKGAENVQLNGNDVQAVTETVQSDELQASVISDCSISDNESPLVVRKDIQNTYSKQERLKSFEITPRQRGDSTGSLSDDLVNSDFEYEDHIGCDDIETGFSDIDEKANDLDESANESTKAVDSGISSSVVVIDTVKISRSPWQKSNIKERGVKRKRKNGHLGVVNGVTSLSDYRLDNIPSPLGGDVVDGIDEPISLDMGDGTVSISRPSRIRQRKTPVKYKDTSFFQGDFVFIDEEESQSHSVSKKRNSTKRTDLNCNSKKPKVAEKPSNSKGGSKGGKSAHVDVKNAEKADAKDCVELPKPPEIKAVIELSPNQNLEKTLKLLAEQQDKLKHEHSNSEKGRDVKVCVISKDKNGHLTSECIQNLDDVKNDTCVKESVLNAGSKSCGRVTKSQSKPSASQKAKSQTPVTRNSAKRTRSSETVSEDNTKRTKQEINGIESSTPCESKPKAVTRSRNKNNLVSHEDVETKVKSKSVKNEPIADADYEVIEINSDNEEGAVKDSGAKCKVEKSEHCLTQSMNVNCDGTQLQEPVRDEYDFSLVDDDILGDKLKVKNEKTDLKLEKVDISEKKINHVPKISGKGPSGKQTTKSLICKKTVKPKKKVSRLKKKQPLDYEDPDFDLGPSLKFLKSSGSSDNLKKVKKKRDKWAEFKGPKIVFEGEKETPDKCAVINDPYEQTCSKKAKLITQNVTRIEISQLPSDKSVLIPNSDSMESEIWKCALCGKHSSYKFLGDLFGPYTVETMSEDMLDLSPKVRLGSGKKWDENQPGTSRGGRGGKRSDSASREVIEWKEVWVHESCAVYSDGVFLLGSKIYGLQEAVRIASQTLCSVCDTHGAMIGCLNKGCQQKFHHACAQEGECYLDEENFSLLCPKHKMKKLKQLEASASAMNTG